MKRRIKTLNYKRLLILLPVVKFLISWAKPPSSPILLLIHCLIHLSLSYYCVFKVKTIRWEKEGNEVEEITKDGGSAPNYTLDKRIINKEKIKIIEYRYKTVYRINTNSRCEISKHMMMIKIGIGEQNILNKKLEI